eukprot:4618374-Prorocentrum_lima.AAC.1
MAAKQVYSKEWHTMICGGSEEIEPEVHLPQEDHHSGKENKRVQPTIPGSKEGTLEAVPTPG